MFPWGCVLDASWGLEPQRSVKEKRTLGLLLGEMDTQIVKVHNLKVQ